MEWEQGMSYLKKNSLNETRMIVNILDMQLYLAMYAGPKSRRIYIQGF
jgi:hypothetical protein